MVRTFFCRFVMEKKHLQMGPDLQPVLTLLLVQVVLLLKYGRAIIKEETR